MSKDYDFINSIIAESNIQTLQLEVAKLQAENVKLKKMLEEFGKLKDYLQ